MREIEKLKEQILKEYPRLSRDDKFTFKCHPGVPCYNECCADINIFLTPYDIIRLKNNLGITSDEFLKQYTISPFDQNLKYPVMLLKMRDDEKKSCHFVAEKGCTVYEDRPWACRMYPVGLASPGENHEELDKEFYFLLEESSCKGHLEKNEQSISEWLKDQGIEEYDKMGRYFKDLTLHKFFREGGNLEPAKVEMFHTVCYNIDKFRDFIFGSTFLDKFEIDENTQKKIKTDDVELLNFGYQWLRFALFGEKTMTIKADVAAAKKEELEKKAEKK